MTTLINNHQQEDAQDDAEAKSSEQDQNTKELPIWLETHLEHSQTRLDDHVSKSQQRFDNLLAKMKLDK